MAAANTDLRSLGIFAGVAATLSLAASRRCRKELGGDVIVVGGGGREHAIAWKISQSKLLSEKATVYCCPGNGGTAALREITRCNVANVPLKRVNEIVDFANRVRPFLVIIGPEAPLAEGIAGEKLARIAKYIIVFADYGGEQSAPCHIPAPVA